MKSDCGIYYIQNKITKQIYIGQSKTLRLRKNRHFYHLRKNKHHNGHLQNSFNKYGEKNFEYGIIQYCKEDELDELEIAYMNLFNVKKHGFNLSDGGHEGGCKKKQAHITLSSFNRQGQRMYKLIYNGQIIRSKDKSFLEYLLKKYFDEFGVLKDNYSFECLKKESYKKMGKYRLINEVRIVKRGKRGTNTQHYSLKYGNQIIKDSIYKDFLEYLIDYFFDENKLLKKSFTIEDVKRMRVTDVRKRAKSTGA